MAIGLHSRWDSGSLKGQLELWTKRVGTVSDSILVSYSGRSVITLPPLQCLDNAVQARNMPYIQRLMVLRSPLNAVNMLLSVSVECPYDNPHDFVTSGRVVRVRTRQCGSLHFQRNIVPFPTVSVYDGTRVRYHPLSRRSNGSLRTVD